MLAIAVSLTFAISATLALGVIALTLRQQAPSVMTVIAQARAARDEKNSVFGSQREAKALVVEFEPTVRTRRVSGGTVTLLTSRRRPANSFSAGPLCAVA
jgi:hypothetical protein